jgi:TPR repeat protein
MAADSGFVPAQMMIALMYARGQGVTKDCEIARRWFERAAAQGADNARAWLVSNDECAAGR